jgi:hypothetical protein
MNVSISSHSEATASFTEQLHFSRASCFPRDFVTSAEMKSVSPG